MVKVFSVMAGSHIEFYRMTLLYRLPLKDFAFIELLGATGYLKYFLFLSFD